MFQSLPIVITLALPAAVSAESGQPAPNAEPLAPTSVVATRAERPMPLHTRELERHRLEPARAASSFPQSPDGGIAGGPTCPPQLCGTVFGFLPYWETGEHIQWDLLTHLACFSLEINEFGNVTNAHGWPWTNVINTAHANGVKVILVATMFDTVPLNNLLGDPTRWPTFFTNMKNQMQAGSADGINIDFEGHGAWTASMPAFLSALTTYMHAEMPGSEVTFDAPPVDWEDEWDFSAIAAACDGIFIMGYDFYGSWSPTSGPSAPLTGGFYNLTYTLETEFADVVAATPEKLILGCPYYGNRWTTVNANAYANAIAWEDYPGYSVLQPQSQTYGVQWDAASQTPWYRFQTAGVWRQVWFDNAQSFDLKIQFAQAHQLQGVGIWALGQDGALPDLWNTIATRYLNTCTSACIADVSPDCGDGVVNVNDLLAVITHWGACPTPPATCVGDTDHNGLVNVNDLLSVITQWGPCQ